MKKFELRRFFVFYPLVQTILLSVDIYARTMKVVLKMSWRTVYVFAECGRTLLSPSAEFSSPEYENENQAVHLLDKDGYRCVWRIEATHGEVIALNITDLAIGHTKDCVGDYLEIRDGYWHKSTLLGPWFRNVCSLCIRQSTVVVREEMDKIKN